ncbi:mechanosensitive ion channel protein MscS [Thioclava sp. JM3]|uniref:mechanosensitive ion channel family protein n=1 Tax=Thioclava sp. JM3 TaxID=1973004 RepID=UPI000B53AB59|nr:mechanosensitive ion channel family protein [Thioclava sp. JM3]OWY11969.1 mechanosensitive ion channel protein MscS [Thioclava sp. JM3]
MEPDTIETELASAIDTAQKFLPDWAVALITYVAAALLALLLFRVVFTALNRAVADRDLFWRSLMARGARPMRLILLIVALGLANGVAPVGAAVTSAITHILLVALILCLAWIAYTALYIWTTIHLRRFKLDAEDNLLARKHVTQTRILMRVAKVMIVIIAVATALMTFPAVRQYGVSLLAAGGAAGLVVGLALQPVLKNLFAGIQLALTQPIRIDDALIVEGEWGNVEEITSTYVVIRVWDWRRLVVPLSYFIEQPFQNWTRESAELIGTVMIYLDHTADIAAIRAKAEEIARADPLWDGKVFALQVTDFRERVMEVRILASARNGPRTFDLRCHIREELVAWIQAEMPHALPRTRADLSPAEAAFLGEPAGEASSADAPPSDAPSP